MDDPLTELLDIYTEGTFDRAIRRTSAPNRVALDTIRLLLVIAKDIRELREQALGPIPQQRTGGEAEVDA